MELTTVESTVHFCALFLIKQHRHTRLRPGHRKPGRHRPTPNKSTGNTCARHTIHTRATITYHTKHQPDPITAPPGPPSAPPHELIYMEAVARRAIAEQRRRDSDRGPGTCGTGWPRPVGRHEGRLGRDRSNGGRDSGGRDGGGRHDERDGRNDGRCEDGAPPGGSRGDGHKRRSGYGAADVRRMSAVVATRLHRR